MTVNGIGNRSALVVQMLVSMRHQLDDLQRQIGTGKKADTYAGVGPGRGLAVGLRTHMSAIKGYGDAISNVGVRLDLMQTALTRIGEIGHEVKAGAAQSAFEIDATGQTATQKAASIQLDEILALLNTRAGDRYLFSGSGADQAAVAGLDLIMNGDGVRAGLKQVITERNQADGTAGLGRLVISAPTATSTELAEDAFPSEFGFKLGAMTSTLTGVPSASPSGTPPALTIDFGAINPTAGQTLQLRFALPDGSTEEITLTATTSATPGVNEFTIGATTADTATNLQAAMSTAVGKLARTSLAAASAMVASDNFFADPPQRVSGPPATATALVAGTAADTVIWYTGENGSIPARATAQARIDQSITVSYGVRANEDAIRWVLQNTAVLAAVTFSTSVPDDSARSAALNERVVSALAGVPGQQKIETIAAELASAQTAMAAAKDRHTQTKSALEGMLAEIEGISDEEVAAQILALQTRLQASLQITAMLFETSLVNYI